MSNFRTYERRVSRSSGPRATSVPVVDELVTRYRALTTELAVVFDAGQNSAVNFAHLTDTGLRFVGSLSPWDHPELLALPAAVRGVVDVERFGGLSA